MKRPILTIMILTLPWPASTSAIAGPCDPYEVVPGVKQLPKGCIAKQTVARPEAIPDKEKRRPRSFEVGDTTVHFGGSVRTEYVFRK